MTVSRSIPCISGGGLPNAPWMQTPLDAYPLWKQTPSHVTCDACWETNPPLLWTEGMTHACENITLPQTSFAGGKYL